MITLFAAAAAASVVMAPSGDYASVKVDVADMAPAAVAAVIKQAATQACSALGESPEARTFCIRDASLRGMRDARKVLAAQQSLAAAPTKTMAENRRPQDGELIRASFNGQ